ncbi:uncharacterized protein N7511_007161 [Penicillium nucicola]|uniref:uncharacterized protein n=1 Tax=Penicillium nucicola TaxID=1850975 RepID=UPI0025456584|nr:uncharacterized protein N7511_007161 [Penicillium nucicola]KAJ5756979.1 hypothetical protein N7511_007161 [Penicillium nucicola]
MDLSRILAANIDGRTQNTRYRQSQFQKLQSSLVKDIASIQDAIISDSGHTRTEVRAEIVLALQEIKTHYSSLSLEKDLEAEYRIARGKDSADARRGNGIVYIIPNTHTFFYSVISALSAALVAGNCIVLELLQTTSALPVLLRKILSEALDHDTFAITTQRPDSSFLNKALIVDQTGESSTSSGLVSPATGRTVAIVDRTANIAEAAQALVAARFALGGRSPYSPDLVLVHEFAMKPFVEAVIQHASKYLAGENGEARSLSRKSGLLDSIQKDRRARVLVSGSNWGVVEVQDRKSPLLQKKIAEKVLLVHPFSSLDDAIDTNCNQTLAATYAFAAPSSAKYLTQFIDAHVSWVNHIPSHMLIGPAIPMNTIPSSETRYAKSQFELPRPQLIVPAPSSVQIILGNDTAKADTLWREAIAPLASTKQKPGFKIGFFEQGIITGGLITLASLVATVSTLGYYTWTYMRRI